MESEVDLVSSRLTGFPISLGLSFAATAPTPSSPPMFSFTSAQRFRLRHLVALFCLVAISLPAAFLFAQESASPTPTPASPPKVHLSTQHAAMCVVKVGDAMPGLQLADARANDATKLTLDQLQGEQATVVVFWQGAGYMAKTLLRDLGPDVMEPLADHGVSVVAVAVDTPAKEALALADKLNYAGPVLLDSDGQAFAQVGSTRLPRVYVLDAEGKIVWFDIEYSSATRRELRQTLQSLVTKKTKAGSDSEAGESEAKPSAE